MHNPGIKVIILPNQSVEEVRKAAQEIFDTVKTAGVKMHIDALGLFGQFIEQCGASCGSIEDSNPATARAATLEYLAQEINHSGDRNHGILSCEETRPDGSPVNSYLEDFGPFHGPNTPAELERLSKLAKRHTELVKPPFRIIYVIVEYNGEYILTDLASAKAATEKDCKIVFDPSSCTCGQPGKARIDNGLNAGIHCDTCWVNLVHGARQRSW